MAAVRNVKELKAREGNVQRRVTSKNTQSEEYKDINDKNYPVKGVNKKAKAAQQYIVDHIACHIGKTQTSCMLYGDTALFPQKALPDRLTISLSLQ